MFHLFPTLKQGKVWIRPCAGDRIFRAGTNVSWRDPCRNSYASRPKSVVKISHALSEIGADIANYTCYCVGDQGAVAVYRVAFLGDEFRLESRELKTPPPAGAHPPAVGPLTSCRILCGTDDNRVMSCLCKQPIMRCQ